MNDKFAESESETLFGGRQEPKQTTTISPVSLLHTQNRNRILTLYNRSVRDNKTTMTRIWLLLGLALQGNAFGPMAIGRGATTRTALSLSSSDETNQQVEALLEKARQMRAEAAALEGRSVEEVEQEAAEKRQRTKQAQEQADQARQERRAEAQLKTKVADGSFLVVPETFDDQVTVAKQAVEAAFRDGIDRQVVRFALLPQGEFLNQNDRQWPGGAMQMYREAAGPLTRELLRVVRTDDPQAFTKQPNVKSQDVWDFDGSALITAEAASGPEHDVQALVQPNTDTKYTKDIETIDKAMKNRLFLLVNPFWRNVESWGFNILAPNGKKLAQQAIFDRGFEETFVLLQKTVRGEDCIAMKVYPYDWQLYAYCESDYWPYREEIIHLGSTKEEPKSSDFGELLEQRDEFKMSKNMRQLQRMTRKE